MLSNNNNKSRGRIQAAGVSESRGFYSNRINILCLLLFILHKKHVKLIYYKTKQMSVVN